MSSQLDSWKRARWKVGHNKHDIILMNVIHSPSELSLNIFLSVNLSLCFSGSVSFSLRSEPNADLGRNTACRPCLQNPNSQLLFPWQRGRHGQRASLYIRACARIFLSYLPPTSWVWQPSSILIESLIQLEVSSLKIRDRCESVTQTLMSRQITRYVY